MILALESSCDETAVAIFDPGAAWPASGFTARSRCMRSTAGWCRISPPGNTCGTSRRCSARPRGGGFRGSAALAVTQGPGLAACLAIGMAAAKALAVELRCRCRGVNHLRGHAWSPFMALHASDPAGFGAALAGLLPHLGLVVSGGNTLLFRLEQDGRLRCWRRRGMTRPAKPSTRGPSCWAWAIPGGR
jgi:N6-L-threonylcarbamoyladenine synthase